MARTTGVVHAAYSTDGFAGDQGAIAPESIRIHGSKVAALEDAVNRGAKYAPWPHGKTLAEAIADYARAQAPRPAAATPKAADK